MNTVLFSGNLARDPEVKVLPSGSVVTNLTVAVSRYFVRKDGTKDKETAFIPCEIWDTAAQFIGENFAKGDFIIIKGSLKENKWEQNGQKKSRLIVRIDEFERGPRKITTTPQPVATTDPIPVSINEEQVPF